MRETCTQRLRHPPGHVGPCGCKLVEVFLSELGQDSVEAIFDLMWTSKSGKRALRPSAVYWFFQSRLPSLRSQLRIYPRSPTHLAAAHMSLQDILGHNHILPLPGGRPMPARLGDYRMDGLTGVGSIIDDRDEPPRSAPRRGR